MAKLFCCIRSRAVTIVVCGSLASLWCIQTQFSYAQSYGQQDAKQDENEGLKAFRTGDHKKAYELLSRACLVRATTSCNLFLARACLKIEPKDYTTAYNAYNAAGRLQAISGEADRVLAEKARLEIQDLNEHVARLIIRAPEEAPNESFHLEIDGSSLGRDVSEIAVKPGTHTVQVHAVARFPSIAEVNIAKGERLVIELKLGLPNCSISSDCSLAHCETQPQCAAPCTGPECGKLDNCDNPNNCGLAKCASSTSCSSSCSELDCENPQNCRLDCESIDPCESPRDCRLEKCASSTSCDEPFQSQLISVFAFGSAVTTIDQEGIWGGLVVAAGGGLQLFVGQTAFRFEARASAVPRTAIGDGVFGLGGLVAVGGQSWLAGVASDWYRVPDDDFNPRNDFGVLEAVGRWQPGWVDWFAFDVGTGALLGAQNAFLFRAGTGLWWN